MTERETSVDCSIFPCLASEKRLRRRQSFHHLIQLRSQSHTQYAFENDYLFSLDIIRQAYPTCGSEGYREPAFTLVQENGSALFGHAGTKYPKATAIVIDYLTNGENMRERITELLEEQ